MSRQEPADGTPNVIQTGAIEGEPLVPGSMAFERFSVRAHNIASPTRLPEWMEPMVRQIVREELEAAKRYREWPWLDDLRPIWLAVCALTVLVAVALYLAVR